MNDTYKEEGRAWFSILLGIPACIGWVAYGAAVLLAPHLAVEPDPLLWAGSAIGIWYLLVVICVAGPYVMLGL